MTLQRLLLRLYRSGALPQIGRRLLTRRTWTIEGGEAAGLRFGFPQNHDFILGSSELPVQKALARLLRPGDVFYDIGANVGFFSLLAAVRVGTNGAVYSFEPVRENAAAVQRNASLNRADNVAVFPVAVGSESGTGSLLLSAWDGGAALATADLVPSAAQGVRQVPLVALDEFISQQRLRPPTVVKIDVEGAELAVLRGMFKTISKAGPIVLYEVDDATREGFLERRDVLDAFMSECGYRVTHLESSYPALKWHVGHSLALPASADLRHSC